MGKYEELVQTILHSGHDGEAGGSMRHFAMLDLAREDHFQCVMELFGGEKHVQTELPDLYRRALNAKTKKAPPALYNDGRVDHAVICDLAASKDQRIYSFGLSSLKDIASQIYSIMSLYNNGKLVGRDFSFEFNRHRAQLDCASEAISDLNGEIRSLLHVTWTPLGSDALQSMVLDAEELEIVEDPVAAAEFSHPVKSNYTALEPVKLNIPNPPEVVVRESQKNEALSFINVCYDRSPAKDLVDPRKSESVNYAYGSTRIGNIQQRIFLDIRGKFSLAEDCTYKKLNSVGIGLELGSGGAAPYCSLILEKENFTVDKDKGEISFKFPTDWSVDIPSKSLSGRVLSLLDVVIEFTYYDGRGGDPAEHKDRVAAVCASSASPNSPIGGEPKHFVQLDEVKLNWGCVEEHTPVQMADGSTREIRDIRPGDSVMSDEYRAARVVNVITGMEKELYAIQAVDGQTLLVSAEHPVFTGAGPKLAMNITPADKLVLADGSLVCIDALYNVQGEYQVYNLELEENHAMICSGYLVGDNDLQGRVMCDEREIPSPGAELHAEAYKLAQYFSSFGRPGK